MGPTMLFLQPYHHRICVFLNWLARQVLIAWLFCIRAIIGSAFLLITRIHFPKTRSRAFFTSHSLSPPLSQHVAHIMTPTPIKSGDAASPPPPRQLQPGREQTVSYADLMKPDEDWRTLPNAADRRKIQNRLAQRAYREWAAL